MRQLWLLLAYGLRCLGAEMCVAHVLAQLAAKSVGCHFHCNFSCQWLNDIQRLQ